MCASDVTAFFYLSGAVLHEAAVTSRLLNWLDSNVKIRYDNQIFNKGLILSSRITFIWTFPYTKGKSLFKI